MDYAVGGRGKKAPYETTHVRIPLPIKRVVLALAEEFRRDLSLTIVPPLTGLEEQVDEDDYNDKSSDPSDLETIQAQAEIIRAYVSEISYLKHKLYQTQSLISLDAALREAKQIFTQKKSAPVSLVKLLTAIYSVDITVAHLKEDELVSSPPGSPSFIAGFRKSIHKKS